MKFDLGMYCYINLRLIYPVSELSVAEISVVFKVYHQLLVMPGSHILQMLGQIPVKQGYHGDDTFSQQLINQPGNHGNK